MSSDALSQPLASVFKARNLQQSEMESDKSENAVKWLYTACVVTHFLSYLQSFLDHVQRMKKQLRSPTCESAARKGIVSRSLAMVTSQIALVSFVFCRRFYSSRSEFLFPRLLFHLSALFRYMVFCYSLYCLAYCETSFMSLTLFVDAFWDSVFLPFFAPSDWHMGRRSHPAAKRSSGKRVEGAELGRPAAAHVIRRSAPL